MIDERSFAIGVVKTLRDSGYEALFAGGCVRDEILGLVPADYDVATSATPDQVQRLFRKSLAVGAAFGVVEVLGPRKGDHIIHVQVATFRSDGPYLDGRRPATVQFGSAREDALRRDFTINGMFLDPLSGEFIDYVGGRDDLKARVVRAIGNPADRIKEDKLRVLRALRMAARFGFSIEKETWKGVVENASQIQFVSPERIADELRRIFAHPTRLQGINLLINSGLYPEVMGKLEPPGEITIAAISHLPLHAPFFLVFSLLAESRDWIENLGNQLKLSRAEIQSALWVVANQGMLSRADRLPNSVLFPLLAHSEHSWLLARDSALTMARGEPLSGIGRCDEFLANPPEGGFSPPPLIDGNDLKELGIAPGPSFAFLLSKIRAEQLDRQIQNSQEAKNFALTLYKEISKGKDQETA